MTISCSMPMSEAFKPLVAVAALVAAFPVYSQGVDQTLERVIVTATRTPQKASDVLSDSIVITSDDIARSGQTSLIDLLQTRRGIEISRNGGPGTTSNVFLRGSNSNQIVLLIDGVRSFNSTSGAPIWSSVPLSQIDRIEIVQGPLSTLYGADAVGGVIQVFTRKGDGAPRLTASAGAGTYDERVITAGVSGGVGGEHPFSYSLNAASEKADGFSATLPHADIFSYNPDKDGYDKQSINGQFSWQLAKGHEAGFTFLNSRNDYQFDAGAGTDDHGLNEVNAYALFLRSSLAKNWNSLLKASRSYSNDYSSYSWGDTQYNSRQETFSWQNDFRIGANTLQVIAERLKEDVASSDTDLNRERTTDSLALAFQRRTGAHLFGVTARYDDNSEYGDHVTGSLGYGYDINRLWRATASYGTSFRAPSYNELYYPGYGVASNRPEKGRNAEIGVRYNDGTSSASVIYYRNEVRDLIVTSTDCPAGYIYGCAANVDEALLTGISFDARTKLNSRLDVYGTLDLQDPKNRTNDKLLQRRAKYHGTVGMDYNNGPVTAGATIAFSGYRYEDVSNTNRLGGYALLNLHASYDLNKDWQLFGRWNNALNKDYELAYGYQTPGSNVFVGVRYGLR